MDGWSTSDLDAWPVSNRRYELTDGALTVHPSPSSLHQAVIMLLFTRMNAVAPVHLAVVPVMEVRFAPHLTRIADLLVVPAPDPTRDWFGPSDMLLAVEIESPGSHVEDRVTKPALYARHGIPHYWRVELDPIRVRLHRLGSGDLYRESDVAEDRLTTDEPFPVDIALADLLPRWAR